MESDVFKLKTVSDLIKINITKFKRFLGFDKSNICGYLYLVNLEFTVINVILSRLVPNRVKDLRIVIRITPEESKMSSKQFKELITSRSRSQVNEYYKDLIVFGYSTHNEPPWSGIIDKLSFLKICPVYKDGIGQEAV
jgi:hypothetical protein